MSVQTSEFFLTIDVFASNKDHLVRELDAMITRVRNMHQKEFDKLERGEEKKIEIETHDSVLRVKYTD